ncbi:hypothetical protein HNV12_22640 [Methanococcoides sp. SA1]|nr:hypothetical protein [Methanococcoides sp. SA1]
MLCKQTLENHENASEIRGKALIWGILFRGLENFINLKKKSNSSIWFKNNSLVENLWVELCDCKDRVNYVSNYLSGSSLAWIHSEITNFEEKFESYFGKGRYASSAIRAKKIECNICGNDMRSCNHLSSAIYDGKMCKGIVTDITNVHHVALVENPADPRCRLWPWNAQKNEDSSLTISGTVLTSFRLDDF